MALNTSLPQRTKPNLTIPSDEHVQTLLEAVRGSTLELPVIFAAFGPMSEAEICTLEMKNIDGNVVHVCENMVKKKGKTGRIVDMNPNTLCKMFKRKLDDLDIPAFRFHELRHYSASIQHALGIPNAYIMQRGGWSSDRVLKSVYRHTMDDKIKEMHEKANSHFQELYHTKYHTE